MGCKFGIVLSFVLIPVLSVYADECEIEERVGYAYDRKSGELLYTEAHCETSDSGRITGDTVTYRGPQGIVFADKRVDFTCDPFIPNFELENPANGLSLIIFRLQEFERHQLSWAASRHA